jgi:hypothetical protein
MKMGFFLAKHNSKKTQSTQLLLLNRFPHLVESIYALLLDRVRTKSAKLLN